MLARGTLGVRECPLASEGADAAFPFTVKQDHIGVVCLLRLCRTCSADPAMTSDETLTALCGDVRAHLTAALAGGNRGTLENHSTIVLAEAVSYVAVKRPEATRELLTTCLTVVCNSHAGDAAVALYAASEVVSKCGTLQGQSVAAALEPAWFSLGESRLDAQALAKFLAALAEHAPTEALRPLAQLVADLFKNRPQTRAPLLQTATSFMHRAGQDVNSLAAQLGAELVEGLSVLIWAEVNSCGQVLERLKSLADSEVRVPGETVGGTGSLPVVVLASDHALIEAWARLMHEASKHASAVLVAGAGLTLAVSAAVSLVAVPAHEPPTKSLALLAHEWKDPYGLCAKLQDGLNSTIMADADCKWSLGALLLRAVMKASLGQMPPTSHGVVVPVARALFQYDLACVEIWLRQGVSGEGFPSASTSPDAKERFIKELLAAKADAQRFKHAFKKLCAGKNQGY